MNSSSKIFLAVFVTAIIVGAGTFYLTRPKVVPKNTNTVVANNNINPSTETACRSAHLQASLKDNGALTGTYQAGLTVKNISSSACSYTGPLMVSLQGADNTVLGSTTWQSGSGVLDPGVMMISNVSFPNPGNSTDSNACQSGVTTLAIYLPNETVPITVTGIDQLMINWTDHFCPGFSVQNLSAT